MSDTPSLSSPADTPSAQAYRTTLSGLSDFDLVEKIAAIHAARAKEDACLLVAIDELSTRDCMRPRPPYKPRPAREDGEDDEDGGDGGAGGLGEAFERLVDKMTMQSSTPLTPADLTGAEIKAKLCLSPSEAQRLVATGNALTTRLPRTLNALMTGRLDLRRATMIHEHATPLAEDHYDMAIRAGASPEVAEKAAARIAGDLERHVLKWAPRQAPKQLGRCLRNAVIRLDPDYAERHRKDAVDGRYVSHRANTDGTGNLFPVN
jgi:hypothetical protein